jgi:HSP20 family molecular chaperone IbpA
MGNYRREIALPTVLAKRDTAGATIKDGELRVRFARRAETGAAGETLAGRKVKGEKR